MEYWIWISRILKFLGVVIFMILTHEMGHFFAAKAVGIKVDQFSIGFGPEIFGRTRGETRYSLKWILAGGSVRISGMNPEEELSEEDLPRSYYQAPLWKRAVVIVAGSAVHVVIAFFLFYLLFWPIGHQELTGSNVIGEVMKTLTVEGDKTIPGPAYEAGLEAGDAIESVAGKPTPDWDELTVQLRKRPGEEVAIVYERDGSTERLKLTTADIEGEGFIGILPETALVKSNPITAIGQAFKLLGQVTVAIFRGFVSLFSLTTIRLLLGLAPRTVESPRSIIGAGELAVQAARQGTDMFIFIIGQFFLLLAIFNLLPLPPLDGGHLAVIIIEAVFHKKVDMKKFAAVAWVVIIILALVALRLMILDVMNM